MFNKTEKAIADWPKMTVLKRKGGVRLHGDYPGPNLDWLANLIFTLLLIAAMYYALTEGGGWQGAAAVAVGMLIPYPFIWRSIMIRTIGRNLNVTVLPDIIQVKRKRYDRSEVRGFRIERHHKAREEARQAQRNPGRVQPVYRQAVEVVMDYGEKRIPIAAMPDKDEHQAEALLYRLQNTFENLDSIVGDGNDGGDDGGGDAFGKPPDIR